MQGKKINPGVAALLACPLLISCGLFSTTYHVAKGTVSTTYSAAKGITKLAVGAGKVIYKVGEFTFEVVMAPLSWPLTNEDLESMDGLPPRDAIRGQRVKTAPYVVKGRRYVPMTLNEAAGYKEEGTASWYGNETLRLPGGHMTANGEVFNPEQLTAAHKYLPLPSYVLVTNLENGRSLIARVNDRGPFVNGRIIDLSAGAAKKLGFYKRGTARVRVENVNLKDEG